MMSDIVLLNNSFHLDNMPNGKSVYIYEYDENYEAILKACNALELKYINRDKRVIVDGQQFEDRVFLNNPTQADNQQKDKPFEANVHYQPSKELEDFLDATPPEDDFSDEIDDDSLDEMILSAAQQVSSQSLNLLLEEQEIAKRERAVEKLEQALLPREKELIAKLDNKTPESYTAEINQLQAEQKVLQDQLDQIKNKQKAIMQLQEYLMQFDVSKYSAAA